MRVIGTPGETPRHLQRRRERRRDLIGVGGGLLALAAFVAGQPAMAAGIVLLTLLIRHRLRSSAFAARAGADGEALVATELRRVRPAVLIFDLRHGRGDIDAVALGPMLASIEVKTGRGRPRPMDDGRLRVGRTWLPGRPLAQASRQAAVLSRAALAPATAVLCVVNLRGRPRYVEFEGGEVLLTSLRHLRRVMRRLPDTLTNRQAKEVAHALRSGNNPSQPGVESVH